MRASKSFDSDELPAEDVQRSPNVRDIFLLDDRRPEDSIGVGKLSALTCGVGG